MTRTEHPTPGGIGRWARSLWKEFRDGTERGKARAGRRDAADAGVDAASAASFPASDPPGIQLPDEPPANADAKWEAADADARRRGVDVPTRHGTTDTN